MNTAVISLTRKGAELAFRLGYIYGCDVYMKEAFLENFKKEPAGEKDAPTVIALPADGSFTGFAGMLFESYDALIFIMACGIVVRAIAPYIRDKRSDPAVVVLDEKGKYAISLLSGHIGRANELAADISQKIGGMPVITTSTDVNGVTAFDVFARENGCVIENFELLKHVSSALVNGGKVFFHSDYGINGLLPENFLPYAPNAKPCSEFGVVISNKIGFEKHDGRTMYIRPQNLILGIGCRKGTTGDQINNAFMEFMELNKKSILSIKCVATIDLKKDEEGIQEFCSKYGFRLCIISRDRISSSAGSYTESEFVREKVGVPSVAEPCAVLGGEKARLICKKSVYKGITLALAEEERIFNI